MALSLRRILRNDNAMITQYQHHKRKRDQLTNAFRIKLAKAGVVSTHEILSEPLYWRFMYL